MDTEGSKLFMASYKVQNLSSVDAEKIDNTNFLPKAITLSSYLLEELEFVLHQNAPYLSPQNGNQGNYGSSRSEATMPQLLLCAP